VNTLRPASDVIADFPDDLGAPVEAIPIPCEGANPNLLKLPTGDTIRLFLAMRFEGDNSDVEPTKPAQNMLIISSSGELPGTSGSLRPIPRVLCTASNIFGGDGKLLKL
jgi:hypothetical protein